MVLFWYYVSLILFCWVSISFVMFCYVDCMFHWCCLNEFMFYLSCLLEFMFHHLWIVFLNLCTFSAQFSDIEPHSDQTTYYEIDIAAFQLSTQYWGVRPRTSLFGIRSMCPSKATCIPMNCWFSQLASI